ncbi:glycosyltransferase family 4 protein [Halococcus sp. AFM35]|uniref:glycosyltransferase family 4 protein n=1 Tax=Halococcus sp. AFM35 TaxID=3421653 RepID=UPI003EBFF35B
MRVSDNLIVEAESVLEQWGENYDHKSLVGPTYVDQSRFDVKVPYAERDPTIGFLGVLNERKGVPSLMESISMVSERRQDLGYKIGGDGPLAETVSKTANELDCLKYMGFIPDDDLVDFYNSLKLLVLPTESEGLPNVALEAMACGTPVLATSVGGLPDLLSDGENGFLMGDDTPQRVCEGTLRAMDHDLDSVSERARRTIRNQYTITDAINRYEQILKS